MNVAAWSVAWASHPSSDQGGYAGLDLVLVASLSCHPCHNVLTALFSAPPWVELARVCLPRLGDYHNSPWFMIHCSTGYMPLLGGWGRQAPPAHAFTKTPLVKEATVNKWNIQKQKKALIRERRNRPEWKFHKYEHGFQINAMLRNLICLILSHGC